jgi:small-conductance mechanosensitive channel
MGNFIDTLEEFGINIIPFLRTLLIVLFLFVVFSFVLGMIKRALLNKSKNKKQKTDIENFSRLFKIVIFIILVFIGIASYVGSFTGLGIAAGLLTAALGWALQRPITGIAAWIMVIIKNPFSIGDRVIIGSIKGDVKDITLTHIVLNEVGGLVNSEVVSGRIVMVPNWQLYEQNIINYTKQHDYIIGEVVVQVTYESNLDRAMKIAFESALKYTNEASEKLKQEPMIRVVMAGSGIDVKVRFYGDTFGIQRITSEVTKEIFDQINKTQDVEIAYPHTEVVFKNKKLFKK